METESKTKNMLSTIDQLKKNYKDMEELAEKALKVSIEEMLIIDEKVEKIEKWNKSLKEKLKTAEEKEILAKLESGEWVYSEEEVSDSSGSDC